MPAFKPDLDDAALRGDLVFTFQHGGNLIPRFSGPSFISDQFVMRFELGMKWNAAFHASMCKTMSYKRRQVNKKTMESGDK